jgi:hypothetical protein
MLSDEIVQKLKERYSYLHPLIIHRSLEKSKKDVDLFDILDSAPKDFPVIWSEENKRWMKTQDIFQSKEFFEK